MRFVTLFINRLSHEAMIYSSTITRYLAILVPPETASAIYAFGAMCHHGRGRDVAHTLEDHLGQSRL